MRAWSLSAFGADQADASTSANRPASDAAQPVDALLSTSNPPFSFRYDGKPSSALLPTWKQEGKSSGGSNGAVESAKWTDPATGLVVEVKVTAYPDFPAVEWVLNFTNTGNKDTPILDNVQALDETLQTTPSTQPRIQMTASPSRQT